MKPNSLRSSSFCCLSLQTFIPRFSVSTSCSRPMSKSFTSRPDNLILCSCQHHCYVSIAAATSGWGRATVYLQRACCNIRHPKVILREQPLLAPCDAALEDLVREIRLLARRPAQPHAVNCLQRPEHRADAPQAAGDERARPGQRRHDGVGEVQKESLALARRLAAVGKGQLLIRAARELDEIDGVRLEPGAQLAALVDVEPFLLELDAVDLDADAEAARHALLDRPDDLEDDARPVLERAAILVGALVRRGRQELAQEIPAGEDQHDRE